MTKFKVYQDEIVDSVYFVLREAYGKVYLSCGTKLDPNEYDVLCITHEGKVNLLCDIGKETGLDLDNNGVVRTETEEK